MRLEDQVPDRELCEALKNAGMPQETLFTWALPHEDEGDEWIIVPSDAPEGWCNDEPRHVVAAPTVAELGKMMPKSIKRKDAVLFIRAWWEEEHGSLEYIDDLETVQSGPWMDCNEATARAKLLLWALQNGHIK